MRVSGFASGMDIDQTVRDLMQAERIPMDKMMQKRQTMEWQMDEYRSVNLLFNEFRNNIFDTVMRRSNMGARSATSSDDSRITAEASSTAGNATYRISEVTQLAQAESQSSGHEVGTDEFNTSETLRSQEWAGAAPNWKKGVLHNERIKVEEPSTTLSLAEEGLKRTM